jgi:hypothetical protein
MSCSFLSFIFSNFLLVPGFKPPVLYLNVLCILCDMFSCMGWTCSFRILELLYGLFMMINKD